ncbi:hypothetical protein GYMLUDRAFT_32868 [Collybiopsis luxurians FD-317 M1]|nr:hypothetical protein GYMLUDRAFT_32868 [Collybiopsis luxurians FD-317 M1]
MASTPKLTKKQKKGIAFRERKSGQKNDDGINLDAHPERNEVPVMEIQDELDIENDEVESEDVHSEKQSADAKKEKGEDANEVQPIPNKKRKRESDSSGEKVPQKKKKSNDKKQRFILFVGNLKYTTTLDSIKEHFSVCDPPPSIRLLTPKTSERSNKSKGCAFLEFTHRNALQQALKLHQSKLDGRLINIEITVGGGGHSSSRTQKLKDRNKKLHEQRKKHEEKSGESYSHPQRYSATSGVGIAPETLKTWSVDDADDGKMHRGGKKHIKKTHPKRPKEWSSGSNAIPVG